MNIFKSIIFSASLALAAYAMPVAIQAQTAVCYADGPIVRSLVMDKGDFGSKFYRIPAITTLPDGTIVVVADKRIDKLDDLPGRIDVVARRSTDGGRTWGPYITVAEHDETGGYGDPAIVYDRRTGDLIVISSHGNGLWDKSPSHTSVSRSRDGGLTWEKPVDISDQIFTTDPNGKQPIKLTAAFASSGRALQLKNGRLMFVLVTRKEGVDPFPCYAIYSDDGGKNWKVSKTPATLDGDESKIVELPNGDLLMSIRARFKNTRKFSLSKDKGVTWTELTDGYDNLKDVKCNGDIISLKHNGRDVLLQSLPAGPWRSNITIYASYDGGKTWPHSYQVMHGPAAYSTMTLLPDGKTIGMVTEEGVHDVNDRHHQGYRLWFTSIPVSDILGE
ncbi:MAG: glycoside hydrolase [Firmicutes bacterium]|nr:glycoside hydrolase [Bacillota bacterium]MCM1401444.1 glycoside hydrolase [Bacteroides sp.]MCM1476802.1 glycoside hydrolase [Bacteroides sp.]